MRNRNKLFKKDFAINLDDFRNKNDIKMILICLNLLFKDLKIKIIFRLKE